MKNALIDPRQPVSKVVGWVPNTNPSQPIIEQISNSARVAEVTNTAFPVAAPLFWIVCSDDVIADRWYYDTVDQSIIVIPSIPASSS